MIPRLTTITPYWGRPETLAVWLKAVTGATTPDVKHIVIFVGEPVPDWVDKEYGYNTSFHFVPCVEDKPGHFSIGHYHNLGARLAVTDWIMKMDVDTIPNVRYFRELIKVLEQSKDRQWFNGGMVYVNQSFSSSLLAKDKMPLSESTYRDIMADLRTHCSNHNTGPAATNFICIRQYYLQLGGSDERFRGYGWEDYQQIFMLEKNFLGANPLPGCVDFDNVTRRCCREISRRRARELHALNPWLVLMHRFHPASTDRSYKSPGIMGHNKKVLLDYIKARI